MSNMKWVYYLLFGLFFPFLATAQIADTELSPRQGGGKFGLIDRHGKVILTNEYDEILGFSHNRARVNKGGTFQTNRVEGGQWGYINKQGEEIIPLQYDQAWYFTEGLAAVQKDGNWMYIDTLGNVQLNLKDRYDQVWHFQDGVAKVYVYDKQTDSRNYGMIDREGNEVVPLDDRYLYYPQNQYIFNRPFNENTPAKEVSEAYDLQGNPLALLRDENIRRIHPEYTIINHPDDPFQEAVADLNGNLLVPYGFIEVLSYGEGKAIGQDVSRTSVLASIATVIDTLGSVSPIYFTKDRFNWPDSFMATYTQVPLTSGPDGSIEQYALEISSAAPFRDQFAVVEGVYTNLKNPIDQRELSKFSKNGLINESGEVILFPLYQDIEVQGFLIATSQRFFLEDQLGVYFEYQLFNLNGYPIFNHPFKDLQLIDGNRAIAQTEDGWGMVNAAGDTIIPFIHQELKPPKDGLILAKKDLKYGYLDTLGNTIIPFRLELARPFEEEVAIVGEGRLWGYADTNGQWVIPDKFYRTEAFSEGFAAVMDHNQKWGFINENGFRRTLSSFSELRNFTDGVAWGRVDRKWGLYGQQDGRIKELHPPVFDEYRPFSKGFAAVEKNGLWGYLKMDGQLLTEIKYSSVTPFSDGLAEVTGKTIDEHDIFNPIQDRMKITIKGLIDTLGREVLPLRFYQIDRLLSTGYISGRVKSDDSIFVDSKFRGIRITNDNRGYFNVDGDVMIPPKYKHITPFEKGIAIVSTGEFTSSYPELSSYHSGLTGIIDLNCNWIIPPVITTLFEFQLGAALFEVEDSITQQRKWGIVSDQGQILQEATFDAISQPTDFGVSIGRRTIEGIEYYGLINRRGAELAPCVFLGIINGEGLYFARTEQGGIVVFDKFGKRLLDALCPVEPIFGKGSTVEYLLLECTTQGYQQLVSVDGSFRSLQYDAITPPRNGYFRFYLNGKVGFFDLEKKEILATGFEDARDFADGYAAVRQNGQWGWINERAAIRPKCQFEEVMDYSGAFVGKTKEGWHVLNQKGKVKTKQAYGYISEFEEDLQVARVIRYGKVGFVNTKGKEIYPPTFDFYDYNEKGDMRHLIRVSIPNKGMGMINADGEIVLPMEYDMVERFSRYGLIKVSKNERYGLVNYEGKTIVPPVYEYVRFIGREMLVGIEEEPWDYGPSRRQPGKYRLFHLEDGKAVAIPSTFIYYQEIDPEWEVSTDHIIVRDQQEKEYLIDRTGKRVSKQYDEFYFDWPDPKLIRARIDVDTMLRGRDTTLTYAALLDGNGKEWIRSPEIISGQIRTEPPYHNIVPRGKWIYTGRYYPDQQIYIPPRKFTNILSPSEETSLIGVRDVKTNRGNWGFYDWKKEEIRIPFQYEEAYPFKMGTTLVEKQGLGFISLDTLGNETIPNAYIRRIERAANDRYFICSGYPTRQGSRVQLYDGIIDRNGRIAVPLRYTHIPSYANGYAAVVNGGTRDQDLFDSYEVVGGAWGIVDSTGREIIPTSLELDGLRLFSGDVAPVRKLGKWGLMNKKARLIVGYEYDDIQDFSNGYALVKKDRQFGYLNEKGELLDSIRYIDARSFNEGYAAVQLDEGWSYLDSTGQLNAFRYDQITDAYQSLAIGNFGGSMTENDWSFRFTGGTYELVTLGATENISIAGSMEITGDMLFLKGTTPISPFSGRPLYELTSRFIESRNSKVGGTFKFSSRRFNWSRQQQGQAIRFIAKMQINDLEYSPFYVLDQDPLQTKDEQYYLFFVQKSSRAPFNERPGFAIPLDDYDQVLPFSPAASIVRKDGNYGLISHTNGREILEVEYTSIQPLEDGKAKVEFPDFYGSFYIDEQGRCVENCDRLQTYQNR
jgi:hypothetical protein